MSGSSITCGTVLREIKEIGDGIVLDGSTMSFYLHGRPAFCPFCTEIAYRGSWYIDNGAIFIGDVLLEHIGLLHVLCHAVHLLYFLLSRALIS